MIRILLLVNLLSGFICLIAAQDIDSIWMQGISDFAMQNYHGVINKMSRIIEIDPENSSAYFSRGRAKIYLGRIDDACNDFNRATELGYIKNKIFTRYQCDPSLKLKYLKKYFYKDKILLPENSYRPAYTEADSLRGSLRPERTCFDVYYYDLTVRIIPKGKRIQGSNNIYFTATEQSRVIQIDLFDNYTINEIKWQGWDLEYERKFNAVFVKFPEQLNPGEKHIITINYEGQPGKAANPPWDGGFVWKRDKRLNRWVGVACEHLGASSWWPNKDHLSDEPDSMKINLEVPEAYQAVSNGILRKKEKVNNSFTRFEWFVSYPINNYNVTFYMGKYARFTDTLILNNDTLLMKYHVLPYNLEKAKSHFKQAREIVTFFNSVFGDYPFTRDGYGLVESPYEGMEHQTAIAYGNKYSTKHSYMFRNSIYDYIILHETAHEWWGNSVSAADMADAWIHEAFATYAELLFIENVSGKGEYLHELNKKITYIYNFWPLVQNRDVNEDSFASSDIYFKGAAMLNSFRCTLNNDSLFFRIIRDFCVKYRYKTVNTDDFITFVNDCTNDNFNPFFNKYLYDTELPVLEYSFKKKNYSMYFSYKWTGVEDGFEMPFCIETNNNESIRLTGNTKEKKIRLDYTSWFNFYNEWKGYQGVEDNSFTYFRTRYKE